MGRYQVLAFAAAVLLMGMGLASREYGERHAATEAHDAHLKVYEEIRPVLLRAMASGDLLCNAAR